MRKKYFFKVFPDGNLNIHLNSHEIHGSGQLFQHWSLSGAAQMRGTRNPLAKWQGGNTVPSRSTALRAVFHGACPSPWLRYTSVRSPEAAPTLLHGPQVPQQPRGPWLNTGAPRSRLALYRSRWSFLKAYMVLTLLLSSIQPFRRRFHGSSLGTLLLLLSRFSRVRLCATP